MARFDYPEEFLKQVDLFNDVKIRHDGDGPASVLNPYLAQQGINLVTDFTNANNAVGQNKLFENAAKDAEDDTQDRNDLFNPVFDNMVGGFQFLKKLYRGNPAELGHWGATVNGSAIVYPADFLKRIDLFTDYKAKHDSYPGDTSPLNPYLTVNTIEMDGDETDVGDALIKHKAAKQKEKDAEAYREERDLLFDPIMDHVRGMGQYLKGLYAKKPKHVGNWGYVVDESPRDPKWRTAKIKPDNIRKLTGVKLGSQVENTGSVDLLLHKGKETGTTPHNLPPEMRFTVKRGWGTMTVQNLDPSQEGEIGYLTVSGLG